MQARPQALRWQVRGGGLHWNMLGAANETYRWEQVIFLGMGEAAQEGLRMQLQHEVVVQEQDCIFPA